MEKSNNVAEVTLKDLTMRIQRRNQLNQIKYWDKEGPGNGRHKYLIGDNNEVFAEIQFQEGPRAEEGSIRGVLDQDLLEIVRHRLQCFQAGPYATRENALALTCIEEALLWMAKRADDRAERGVLGTLKK
jgi:hypothetical protein